MTGLLELHDVLRIGRQIAAGLATRQDPIDDAQVRGRTRRFWPLVILLALSEVTASFRRSGARRPASRREVFLPLVYGELQVGQPAARRRSFQGKSLQSSDLAHEAYLRLVGEYERMRRMAAPTSSRRLQEAMRRILVEKVAERNVVKLRGGARLRVDLKAVGLPGEGTIRRPRSPERGPQQAGSGRPGDGRAGQAPLLRRPDHARDRPGARDFAGNRRAPLDLRPHLALCRAQGPRQIRKTLRIFQKE